MNIPFSPPDITEEEIEEVIKALMSGWITTGPRTKEFENKIAEYVGTSRAAALASQTAAMELTLRYLGIGPGDEVITSSYTYTATASVIDHVGAKIVLVDTSEDSYEMDYSKLEEVINERTKAIIAVDIAGRMCNYEKLYEIAERKKVLYKPKNNIQKMYGRINILSDSAHGFGSKTKLSDGRWQSSGQVADFTCFSFHAVKNLTTAEGGAVTWKTVKGIDDDEVYKSFMIASLHGQTKDALNKTAVGSWEYDILYPAYKCNMTDLQAAIGLMQLKRYENMLERRHFIIERYNKALDQYGIKYISHNDDRIYSSGHLYLMRVPNISEEKRNELIRKFAEMGVTTNVHYKPLPMLTAYKNLGFNISNYPNAYKMYENEITLPLYSKLKDEEVTYIIESIEKIFNEVN